MIFQGEGNIFFGVYKLKHEQQPIQIHNTHTHTIQTHRICIQIPWIKHMKHS